MQKILITTLAAAGLLAASQASFANTVGHNPEIGKAAANSAIVLTAKGGGGGGHAGGFSTGGHVGALSRGGHVGAFSGGRSFAMGHRGHFNHGRGGFYGGYGYGLGWDFGYPYGYDGGSCYWNCRNEGYGPRYCQAYAPNFCY